MKPSFTNPPELDPFDSLMHELKSLSSLERGVLGVVVTIELLYRLKAEAKISGDEQRRLTEKVLMVFAADSVLGTLTTVLEAHEKLPDTSTEQIVAFIGHKICESRNRLSTILRNRISIIDVE